MLVCMDPSSPPVKRTLHLLKTPDILLANDNGLPVSYLSVNTGGRGISLYCLSQAGHHAGQPLLPVNKLLRPVAAGKNKNNSAGESLLELERCTYSYDKQRQAA